MREEGLSMAEVVPISRRDEEERAREPLLRDVVGDLLRRERVAQRRTLSDVAESAQVSKPYLSEVERGIKEPSSEVLGAICRSLGIRLVDLVSRTHEQLRGTVVPSAPSVPVPSVPVPSVPGPSRTRGPLLLAA